MHTRYVFTKFQIRYKEHFLKFQRVSYIPKCEGSYLQSEQNQNFNDPLWMPGYLKFFMSEGKIQFEKLKFSKLISL